MIRVRLYICYYDLSTIIFHEGILWLNEKVAKEHGEQKRLKELPINFIGIQRENTSTGKPKKRSMKSVKNIHHYKKLTKIQKRNILVIMYYIGY